MGIGSEPLRIIIYLIVLKFYLYVEVCYIYITFNSVINLLVFKWALDYSKSNGKWTCTIKHPKSLFSSLIIKKKKCLSKLLQQSKCGQSHWIESVIIYPPSHCSKLICPFSGGAQKDHYQNVKSFPYNENASWLLQLSSSAAILLALFQKSLLGRIWTRVSLHVKWNIYSIIYLSNR